MRVMHCTKQENIFFQNIIKKQINRGGGLAPPLEGEIMKKQDTKNWFQN